MVNGVGRAKKTSETEETDIGAIRPEVTYTLKEFKRRAQLGDGALRKMRRAGFPVRYTGSRGYVRGQDFIDFVSRQGTLEYNPPASDKDGQHV